MNVCPVHQMPLGPRGCPQCLRNEVLARAADRTRFWRWTAIVFLPALAALALAALALGAWLAARTQPQREPRLDPSAFRAPIQTIESVLYETEAVTSDDRRLLGEGLRGLISELRRARPSLAQRRALEAVEPFCLVTAVEADEEGFNVLAARRQWEALRAKHFVEAPWFRASSPALEQAQASGAARGMPADAHLYQPALDQLRLLATRVETVLQSLPEHSGEDLEGDTHERWRAARLEVRADLERIRQQSPAPFEGMEPSWRRAYNDLEKAMREVPGMLGGDHRTPTLVPNATEGRYRIQRARYVLEQAQASLDAAAR